MTNDKALEAVPDAAIVAKAMACSEWPKWLFDLTDLTNRASDEADMSTEQAVAFAVLSYLSALPGEAEVVAWRWRDNDHEPWQTDHAWWAQVRIDEVRARYTSVEPLVTLASLQAMQARAEAAERERDECERQFQSQVQTTLNEMTRAEAEEARVKELEEALADAVSTLGPAGNIAFNMKQTAIYTSDRENFRRVGEAIDRAIEAARTALTGGSNG